MNIYLTAIITAKSGKAAAMEAALKDLVAGSTKEDACLQYDLHQSTEDEHIFIFHELWRDQEGLDLHNEQPHIKIFVAQSANIINGPVVLYKTTKLD